MDVFKWHTSVVRSIYSAIPISHGTPIDKIWTLAASITSFGNEHLSRMSRDSNSDHRNRRQASWRPLNTDFYHPLWRRHLHLRKNDRTLPANGTTRATSSRGHDAGHHDAVRRQVFRIRLRLSGLLRRLRRSAMLQNGQKHSGSIDRIVRNASSLRPVSCWFEPGLP